MVSDARDAESTPDAPEKEKNGEEDNENGGGGSGGDDGDDGPFRDDDEEGVRRRADGDDDSDDHDSNAGGGGGTGPFGDRRRAFRGFALCLLVSVVAAAVGIAVGLTANDNNNSNSGGGGAANAEGSNASNGDGSMGEGGENQELLDSTNPNQAAAYEMCVDAGLSNESLDRCVEYCGGGCSPDSDPSDDNCGKLRRQFFESSGRAVFPCDCLAAEADEERFLEEHPPPEPEPVVTSVLAVPPEVDPDTVSDANFHPNGEHIIYSGELLPSGESANQTQQGGRRGKHIFVSLVNGSDFSCLTCSLSPTNEGLPLVKIDVFSDGRRLVVGNHVAFGLPRPFPYPSPFSSEGPYETVPILECTPTLLDCKSAELVYVRVPYDPDDPLLFPNQRVREFRIAPDGVHLAWSQVRDDFLLPTVGSMGELRRVEGDPPRYELDNVETLISLEPPFRPLAVPIDDPSGLDGNNSSKAELRPEYEFVPSHSGEIKRFDNGGLSVAGAYKGYGLNRDAGLLDVSSGTVSRLTSHPDYDEPVDLSPDGRWMAVGSKRGGLPSADGGSSDGSPGNGTLAAFGLVPRPNFVNLAGSQLISVWAFQGSRQLNRGLDTWLVDAFGSRGKDPEYVGQRLSDDPCYGGFERQHWNADGTRVAKGERIRPIVAAELAKGNPEYEQCRGLPRRRLVVFELDSRAPIPPEDRPEIVRTPDAPWASQITDPKHRPDLEPGTYVVPGRVFGEARVTVRGKGVGTGGLTVEYRNYTDDGLLVLNGFEAIERMAEPQLPPSVSYPADIEVSGCRAGYLRSDASWVGRAGIGGLVSVFIAPLSGSARSSLGDRAYAICEPGLSGVDTCPPP